MSRPLNIVVLVKQVPDSGSERTLRPEDATVDRDSASLVINEMDEYAIEEALKIVEQQGGEVTLLTMGSDKAVEAIRKALSMGAHKAVHVSDPALHGSCALSTAKVLGKALGTLQWDLVLCGAQATDGQMAAVPAMLSELTGATQLTGARKLNLDGEQATVERQTEDGYQIVTGALPAIVSVWDTINEPRYPSFRGIMQAKSKPITTLTLADLGVQPNEVGLSGASTEVLSFAPRAERATGTIITDEGEAGAKLVEFLATEKLV